MHFDFSQNCKNNIFKTNTQTKRAKKKSLLEDKGHMCVFKKCFYVFFFSVCKSALRKLRDIFEHTSFFKNYDVLDILQVWTKRKVASISSLALSLFMLWSSTPDRWNSQKNSFDLLALTLNKTRLAPPIYELISIPVIHQKK